MSRFYITTAIDYPNGQPHMGHAYEKIVADTYARWNRWLGNEVFYLTGTDENGQKLMKAAEEAGLPTAAFVDRQAGVFRQFCDDLQITHDDFIRTTEQRHHKVAQELWKKLEAAGKIYEGTYNGLYCLQCENFYPESQAENGKCPYHGVELEPVEEKGFFFKLSEFENWIIRVFESDVNFVRPENARKEILNRVKSDGVKDISISRPNKGWGIPIPGNEDYVMYTWFDALINYYTAPRASEKWAPFWPADMHVIGKDIVWFHAVIWPCMLKACEIELPKQIYVHGMVLGQDGKKMSKSLGNGVDPYEVIKDFPNDSFRYYLLRAIPSGLDGAFVIEDLKKRHNNELANDFGNLLSRVVKLAIKKSAEYGSNGIKQDLNFESLPQAVDEKMQAREHHRALDLIWEKVNEVNLYLNEKEPWRLKEESQRSEFNQVIYNSLYGIHCVSNLLLSFLPGVAEQALGYLGAKGQGPDGFSFGGHEFQLSSPESLFPKID